MINRLSCRSSAPSMPPRFRLGQVGQVLDRVDRHEGREIEILDGDLVAMARQQADHRATD
jgi:hypothetical protein